MPSVTFDAVGPSSSGYVNTSTPTASSQSWTHTVAATANLLIAWIAFDGANTAPTCTMKAGSTSMTGAAANPIQNGGTTNTCFAFTLFNPPTGSVTITATVTNVGGDAVTGGSLSFIGAGSLGTPTVVSSHTGAITLTCPGVASTSMVAGLIGTGSTPTNPTTGTNRFQANGLSGGGQTNGQSEGATNVGSGSVSVAWNNGSTDSNCGWAVEVLASGGSTFIAPCATVVGQGEGMTPSANTGVATSPTIYQAGRRAAFY